MPNRLERTRLEWFVGRGAELRAFEQAVAGGLMALFVHGPGGVGKTTLLARFAALAQARGAAVVRLDCRYLDPSPLGFELGLQSALGTSTPLESLAREPRTVLLLDTYEALAPLDGWLREQLLPQLPPQVLLVLAGRDAPGPGWRGEVGWGELFQALPLGNLSRAEGQAYLDRRGLAGDPGGLLSFTGGHPLALSLLAEVWGQNPGVDPLGSPDLIGALVQRFVREVPGPLHRLALEAAAQLRALNEAQLRAALQQNEVHDVFAWLRGLSFIEGGPFGLFPHDLVRDLLDADFRWRDPDAYAELHRRMRGYYFGRIRSSHGPEQLRHLFDLVFLHRRNPVLQPFYNWKAFGSLYSEAARPADHAAIAELVAQHEGDESAALARYWLARQPEAFTVVRGGRGEVAGVMGLLELTRTAPADAERDPAVAAAWQFMREVRPPRAGQAAVLCRFFMAQEGYQLASPVTNHLGLSSTQCWLTNPRLSWALFAVRDPAYYHDYLSYYDFQPCGAGYDVGGHRYTLYAHDWREVSAAAWLERVGERELAHDPLSAPVPPALPKSEFAEAVKAALRDLHRLDALSTNPLLTTRLLRNEDNPALRLRDLLWKAAQALKHRPKDEKFYRALEATYLEPAATQELAAERLGLPFGTYRYQLTTGLARVTAWLWQRAY